jgi:hypothetical protein
MITLTVITNVIVITVTIIIVIIVMNGRTLHTHHATQTLHRHTHTHTTHPYLYSVLKSLAGGGHVHDGGGVQYHVHQSECVSIRVIAPVFIHPHHDI